MKAKYIGHPDDRAEETVPRRVGYAGKSFPRGHFVTVDGLKDAEIAKLRANPSFEVSDEALTEEEAAAAVLAGSQSPPPGSEPPVQGVSALDKPQLLEKLAALKEAHPDAEIEFSASWGEKRLRQVLEDAEFAVGDEA